MQSRKDKNLAIERDLRRKKRIFTAIASIVAVCVLLVVAYVIWDANNRRRALTFDGTRVQTSDLMFFRQLIFFDEPMDDEIRHIARLNLLRSLVVLHETNRLGLTQTAEQLEEQEFMLDALLNWYPPGSFGYISRSRMIDLLSAWPLTDRWFQFGGAGLAVQLMDYMLPQDTFVLDAEDQEMLDMHVAAQLAMTVPFMQVSEVRFIATDDVDDVIQIAAGLDTYPFEELAMRYSITMLPDEETGEVPEFEVVELFDFMNMFSLDMEEWEAITILEVGEVTTLDVLGLAMFVELYSRTDPEDDEVRAVEENIIADFLQDVRDNAFLELIDELIETFDIEENRRVIDSDSW